MRGPALPLQRLFRLCCLHQPQVTAHLVGVCTGQQALLAAGRPARETAVVPAMMQSIGSSGSSGIIGAWRKGEEGMGHVMGAQPPWCTRNDMGAACGRVVALKSLHSLQGQTRHGQVEEIAGRPFAGLPPAVHARAPGHAHTPTSVGHAASHRSTGGPARGKGPRAHRAHAVADLPTWPSTEHAIQEELTFFTRQQRDRAAANAPNATHARPPLGVFLVLATAAGTPLAAPACRLRPRAQGRP